MTRFAPEHLPWHEEDVATVAAQRRGPWSRASLWTAALQLRLRTPRAGRVCPRSVTTEGGAVTGSKLVRTRGRQCANTRRGHPPNYAHVGLAAKAPGGTLGERPTETRSGEFSELHMGANSTASCGGGTRSHGIRAFLRH